MREDSKSQDTTLHWHDGSTCHGSSTLDECTAKAVANQWTGKVLECSDSYHDGRNAKCYSLIASNFDHWGKFGKFVAEVRLVVVSIKDS